MLLLVWTVEGDGWCWCGFKLSAWYENLKSSRWKC